MEHRSETEASIAPHAREMAFSLVELSIVLVILGLLVGGVLSGQSLIHAAELRAVMNEEQRFVVATNTFKDKYFALPGDMNNATKFWGIAGGTGSDFTCGTVISTDAKTCNGNGDGQIAISTSGAETSFFWQHLANAGLIEGHYTGSPSTFDVNFPKSKYGDTYWYLNLDFTTPYVGDTSAFNGIIFGSALIPVSSAGSFMVFTPTDAWNIDKKMDDGNPGSGKILATKGDATYPCTNKYGQVADTGALYSLSNTDKVCGLNFISLFGT